MRFINATRIVVQTLAMSLLICGIGLLVASVFVPHWQTVELHQTNEYHVHGLWEDCVSGHRFAGDKGLICQYKIYGKPDDGQSHHRAELWRLIVLICVVTSSIIAMVAVVFACCASVMRGCSVTWAILSAISSITGAAGPILFLRYANDPQNKFVLVATESFEQVLGVSFWLAVAGASAIGVSSLLSILTTVMIFAKYRRLNISENSNKTFPSNHA